MDGWMDWMDGLDGLDGWMSEWIQTLPRVLSGNLFEVLSDHALVLRYYGK